MNDRNLPNLPVGIFNFEQLRTTGKLYVDKTDLLMKMCDTAERVFLSRPRRFGKSLTLSTLKAMFSGRAELFKGLAAEEWVAEQAKHPNPVLHLDIGNRKTESPEAFERSLINMLEMIGEEWDVPHKDTQGAGDYLRHRKSSCFFSIHQRCTSLFTRF